MKEKTPNSETQKRPYSPPKLTKVTPEQAEQMVKDRTNCSDSEAKQFMESLRSKQKERAA